MIIKVVIYGLLVIGALYIFWKRLKEDYINNQIFTTFFYSLFGIAFSVILSNRFFPKYWFWAGFFGLNFGLGIGVLRFKLRTYETMESAVISFLMIICGIFLFSGFSTQDKFALGYAIINILLLTLFFIFDKHYKQFNWYKSGRVGFSGLAVLGIFFLIRTIIASGVGDMISFLGKTDIILSGVISFISFLALFNLSRKVL